MRRPKAIVSLLEDFFNLTYGCMIEFLQLLEGKSGRFEDELREYKHGQIDVMIRNYFNSELAYICFLEEYVKMISKWLETFSCLVDILGSGEYHRILLREVKLSEATNTSEIDINFLKFRIKNFLNPNLSDLETMCTLLLEQSKNVLEDANLLKDASSKMLVGFIENQARKWLMVYEELQNLLRPIIQVEDKSQTVSTLTLTAQKFIIFFEKIKQIRKYIKVSDEYWYHFIAGDFIDFPRLFQKIRNDITELFNYLIKTYEHLVNCFFHILTALWGKEEVAHSKIENFIKSKISAEGLVPKTFSLKDLAFGLALARSEWGQAHLASQGLDEKKIAIDIAARVLPKSENIQIFPSRIIRLLELREKYLYKINDIIIDIQKMVQQDTQFEKTVLIE